MRRFGFAGGLAVVTCAVLVGRGHAAPANSPEAVRVKRTHLKQVVEELSARDTSALTEAQRERRARVLGALRRYAERGVFPHNTELPRFALPYFIDAHGTRCALAYAIDRSGAPGLALALAARDNHVYVASLTEDRALKEWLEENGLTLAEAAYIQAPGIVDDPSDPGEPWSPPGGDLVPGHDTPSGGAAPTPAPTPGATTRTRPSGFDAGGWEFWWRYNRDAFVNLRARFHGAFATTGPDGGSGARRPDRALLREKVLPVLARLAAEGDEARATATMALALAEDGAPVVAATLDYLRNPDSRYRDLLVLALGLAGDRDGTKALAEIAGDTAGGRRLLARRTKIPERTRAFAAVALGRTRDPAAVAPLRAVLAEPRGRDEDLRSAAVTSLGDLARHVDPKTRDEIVSLLTRGLERERWTDRVLATIPLALAKAGDGDALAGLVKRVARFRGERDLRQSAALALGVHGRFDAATVEALLAAARRDPDVQTRRHAAIAVGELALRHEGAADKKLVAALRRFYVGTLDGHFKQPQSMEYHILSAGLFLRRFPEAGEGLHKRLVRVARKGRHRDRRAAAVLALGLAGRDAGRDAVRGVFRAAKDTKLRGCAAEALGLLGESAEKDALLEAALRDPSGAVRYQAALGLGYLADGSMTEPLVEALATTGSAPARAALTRVLGQIGDRRAIDGLLAIAVDEDRQRETRERALGALGLIAREADRGWTFDVRRGFNFAQATPVLRVVLGIF